MHIAWRKAAVNGEDAPSPLRGGLGGGIQTDVRPLRETACLGWDPPPDLPRKGGGVAFRARRQLGPGLLAQPAPRRGPRRARRIRPGAPTCPGREVSPA